MYSYGILRIPMDAQVFLWIPIVSRYEADCQAQDELLTKVHSCWLRICAWLPHDLRMTCAWPWGAQGIVWRLCGGGCLCILMDSYGFPSVPRGIPVDSYGFLWLPISSYGFLCIPMESCGFLWIPMYPARFLCIPMDSYVLLWIPMDSKRFLEVPMDS